MIDFVSIGAYLRYWSFGSQVYFFLLSFMVSMVLTYVTILITKEKGWVHKPSINRWNRNVVSLHGGVAMVITYLIVVFLFADSQSLMSLGVFLILPVLMMIVGLIDDQFYLQPWKKVVVEVVIAIVAIKSGFSFDIFEIAIYNYLLTIFWVVGIINAVNLLDNMDGAAAGVCLLITLYLSFFPGYLPDEIREIAIIISGVLLAFLVFNFNPAKVFMGDSGSLFLGAMLALLLLKFSEFLPTTKTFFLLPHNFFIAVALMIIPISDTILVFINRKLKGVPVSQGDKGHITHRISYIFKDDKVSVIFLYLYQAFVLTLLYFNMYLAILGVVVLSAVLLLRLTLMTNHFVWPNSSK